MRGHSILLLLILASCHSSEHQNRNGAKVVIVTDPPKNFGAPIFAEGRVVFDGEAPIFVSMTASSAYWLVGDPSDIMSKLRTSWRPGRFSCIKVRGTAVISGNLTSRHAFVNHRAIRFGNHELGALEAECRLSPQEEKLTATEI
jgi:hypothetical protein